MAWIEEKKRRNGTVSYWVRYRVDGRNFARFAGITRDEAERKLVDYEIELQRNQPVKGSVARGVA